MSDKFFTWGPMASVAFSSDELATRRGSGAAVGAQAREVLVVEDDADTRYLLQQLLISAGFEVYAVANGRAALEWLDAHEAPPACIVLDLQMPVMDGWEFMRRLQRRLERPPVVVLSSAPDPPEGAILYLSKPPSTERLIRTIHACCAAPADAGGNGSNDHR